MLATRAGGDGRVALAALERAAEATRAAGDAEIGVAAVEDALQRKALLYDREGDKHYDYISAWIKATRGSDVDASIYYLAVMLEGGEDPRFIARRMVIFASEDIGNADPQALLVANAAAQAVDRVGLPGVRAQPLPGGRLPGAGAEVERLDPGDLARRARTSASTAPPSRRPTCRTPTTRAPGSSAAARATATRTTSPAGSPTSRWRRSRSEASASTSRPTAASRRSCASGSSACAGCARRISARVKRQSPNFSRRNLLGEVPCSDGLSDALAVVRFAGASA